MAENNLRGRLQHPQTNTAEDQRDFDYEQLTLYVTCSEKG